METEKELMELDCRNCRYFKDCKNATARLYYPCCDYEDKNIENGSDK
jgi:hypothetical protein